MGRFVFLIALLCSAAPQAGAGVVTSPWSPVGGQAGAAFASAVAPAGDVNGDGYTDVLVGAPLYDNGQLDEGRAYLYLGSVNGLAASPAWTFESNQAGAHAGAALASAGDVNYDGYFDVLVAAPDYDRPAHVDAGIVFVFYGSAAGLHAAPDDTLANDATGSRFGTALGYAGLTSSDPYVDVVIGAPDYSNGQANEGAVYVYPGGFPKIATTPSFTFESNETGARAGHCVAGAGDVNSDGFGDLIIGEPGAAPGAHPAAGRMIILPGSAGGPTPTPIATVNGSEDSLAVGTGVAPAGDVDGDGYADVLVGVPGENGAGTRRGSFRCYRGTSSGLDPTPLFVIFGMFDQDRAGAAVATAGDLDGDGYADFVFGDPLGFPGRPGLVNLFYGGRPNTAYGSFIGGIQANGRFGAAAATAGDFDGDGLAELIVGAPDWSEPGLALEGKAFAFLGGAGPPTPFPFQPPYTNETNSSFGASLAIVPSLHPYDTATLYVGEPGYDGPIANSGRVRRYTGRPTGVSGTMAADQLGTANDGLFGYVVVSAGDVDRDGVADLVVGSPWYSADGISERGRAQLFRNTNNGPVEMPWVARGDQAEQRFATAIAGRGDVNGDGYADVVIGSYNWIGVNSICGKASLYLGGPAGLASLPAWEHEGKGLFDNYGYKVAMLDYDADGYSDVAVAAASVAPTGPPRVEIFYGGPNGLPSQPAFSLSPSPPLDTFASELANVGDWDCDGVADLAVGAPDEFGGAGAVFLYPGSRARSVPRSRRFVAPAGTLGAGTAISGGGDLDGDGRADFVVGAPQSSHPESGEGRLYVFRGRPSQGILLPDTTLELDVAGRNLGGAIAPLADLTGDGYADILASAQAGGGMGTVHGWFGGGEGALQYVAPNEAATAWRMYSPAQLESTTKVGFLTVGRSAAGRTRVQGNFEIVPQAQPFTNVRNFLSETELVYDLGPPDTYGSTGFAGYSVRFLWTDIAYHVRWRAATGSPYFPHSRWLAPEGRASGDLDFRTAGTGVVAAGGPEAASLRLARPVPNPSRNAVRLAFEIPLRVPLRLDVYDVRGRHVRKLADEPAFVGPGTRAWDGTDAHGVRVAPGLYFVELRAGDAVARSRIVRLD